MAGEKIQARLAIIGWRRVNDALDAWERRFAEVHRYGTAYHWLDHLTAWNVAFRDFLAESKMPRIIFADADMVPDQRTEPLLLTDEPVACVRYCRGDGSAVHMGGLGLGIAGFDRKAIEKVQPPWATFELSADGCSIKTCPCGYLEAKLGRVGYRAKQIGQAGHLKEVAVWPKE